MLRCVLPGLCLAACLCAPVAGQAAPPSSRSLQVSEQGSVFVTALNPTAQAFTNCTATLDGMTVDSGNFSYQRTDPATNQVVGNVNDRFDIPAGGMQTWIQFLQPAMTHAPQEVQVDMVCDGFSGQQAPTVGVDTFAFSVSTSRPLDVVAVGATISNDGILRIGSVGGSGAFAVASANLGSGGPITVSAGTGQTSLPVPLTVCQTNVQAQCLQPPAAQVAATIATNDTPTFSVFATAQQVLPFSPGANRIYLNFYDQSGTLRGRTSVAVTTTDVSQSNPSSAASTTPTSTTTAGSAGSTGDLLDMIGVNTHLDFSGTAYQNLSATEAAINYLGIKNLRDSAQNPNDLTAWTAVAHATGARFDDYMGEASPAQDTTDLSYVTGLAAQGILNYVEGGNENDDAYAISQGNSIAWTAQFQQQVFSTGHALGLPVINMSFGAGWTAANDYHGDYDKVGDLSPYCDFANAHTYPVVGATTLSTIQMLNSDAHLATASRPVMTTEIGWNNSSYSQYDAARFALDAVFDGIKTGNVKMYFYALFDDSSGQYGLMNSDGSPKTAGAAIHNLTTILADAGAATAGALNYGISGTTANDNTVLAVKSNGTFELAVWNETDGGHNLTLTLPNAVSAINIYDPLSSSTPQASYPNTASVAFATTDHPLIVEIVP